MQTKTNNPTITEILGKQNSKIINYKGVAGLKIVSQNTLKTQGILRIYEITYSSLNQIYKKPEAEQLRQEFLNRKIKIREITNEVYKEKYTDLELFDKNCMDIRYVDPKKLKMKVEFLVYNNVVAFYSYEKEIFSVEIYNQELADTQKQIFDMIWAKAERPIIGPSGRSSLF